MKQQPAAIYSRAFPIPQSAIDENGHVNNVTYVQWMQEIATEHYHSLVGELASSSGGAWVVREHRVTYLSPGFVGEPLEIRTWVVDLRRVRSLRRYEFVRTSDGKVLARGETDWIFLDPKTGAPRSVPAELAQRLPLLPD